MKVLKIYQQDSPENPFNEFDGLYPCITDNKDYSKGEIDRYLQSYLTNEQKVLHQKKLINLLDLDYIELMWNKSFRRIEIISDELDNFISDSMKNKAEFCEAFGIKHYFNTSRGYSQSCFSDVFVCWTPEFEKKTGVTYKKVSESDMKHTFDMYGYWAWGDVFGFKVFEKTLCECCGKSKKTELDSCWGFYGDNHFNSGLADHVRAHFDHLTDQEFEKMIENIEIKY